MKALNIIAIAVATVYSVCVFADGTEEDLLSRNRVLDQMQYNRDRLHIQAEMAKSYKDMNDAGFIVDYKGVPLGIGNMEVLAKEVRNRGGMQSAQGFGQADPFLGTTPGMPMPLRPNPMIPQTPNALTNGAGMFDDPSFGARTGAEATGLGSASKPGDEKGNKPEVVAKPSESEKKEGKKVLRLVELRGKSAVFFTNDGFKEVHVGEKVYDMKLASIGADSANLHGKEGTRIVRIDWTKPVRYRDE